MKARKGTRGSIFVIALAAVAVGVGFFLRPPERTLLDVSTKMLSMQQFGTAQKYTYLWQSDQTLLIFRSNVSDGNVQPERRWDVLRYDVNSGLSDHLSALEAHFNDSFYNDHFYPPLLISPNGQWVAWPTSNKYIAATLDGKSSVNLPADYGDEVTFTNDSLNLIDLVEEQTPKTPPPNTFPTYSVTHVTSQNLEDPASHDVRPIASSSPLSLNRINYASLSGAPWVEFSTKAISKDNILYCYGIFEDSRFPVPNRRETVVDIYHLDLTKQGNATARTSIKFPHGSWVSEMPFSDDGTRIAFLLHQRHPPLVPEFIRRFFPSSRDQERERTSLVVSRIDGSERHTIGHLDESYDSFYDIHWLPGDRYLSFLYHNELWKVPSN